MRCLDIEVRERPLRAKERRRSRMQWARCECTRRAPGRKQ